ncbi:MAG: sugar nucleotide-binding protein [Patescibacteria group bacterium]|jgi:dTDP-4-dehydrorhamnose reductase
MKVLLLGANSYVGSRVYLELKKDHEVVGTFHNKKLFTNLVFLDVTDRQAVMDLIIKEKPNVIVHCANQASNRWCEEHLEDAVKINREATKFIVEGANIVDSKVIYVSSFAAISPTNLYGIMKEESERMIKTVRSGYAIIQPGVIVGISPKIKKEDGFFSSLMENLNDNKPAEYDNIKKYQPTYLGHICEVIKLILERGLWNKTFPVASLGVKTKYELAKDILSPFGITVEEVEGSHTITKKKTQGLKELNESSLPVYTYMQTIEKVVEEIKASNC